MHPKVCTASKKPSRRAWLRNYSGRSKDPSSTWSGRKPKVATSRIRDLEKEKEKGKNSNSYSNSNGSVDMSKKKCTYCQKPNHGQDECFSRIRDNAPCYNSKGEPYYPRNQANKQVNHMGANQRNNRGTNPPPSQPSTKASDQGFPGWV